MRYIVEIFMNETDSIQLHDVIFFSVVANVVKIDRTFDEPIFDLNEIHHVEIRAQK